MKILLKKDLSLINLTLQLNVTTIAIAKTSKDFTKANTGYAILSLRTRGYNHEFFFEFNNQINLQRFVENVNKPSIFYCININP